MAKPVNTPSQGWGAACRASLLLGWSFALADTWLLGWRSLWPNSGLAQALQACAILHAASPVLLRVIAGVDNTLLVTLLIAITFASSGQLSLVMLALVGWVVATRLLVAPLSARVWAKLTGLDAALAVFFATYGVATAFASTQPQALVGLAKMALYAGVWLAFRCLALTHRRFASIAVVTLALAGVVQAGIGWWQQLHYVPALATWSDAASQHPDAVLTRVYGTIQPLNPNLYAGVLLPCWAAMLACCGLVLWRPAGLSGWQVMFRHRWLWLLLGVAALGLIALAIVWSGSRGAYLGLGGMLLTAYLGVLTYVTVDRFQRYKPWLLAGWCIVLALGLLGLGGLLATKPEIAHRLSTITAGHKDSSIAYRLNVYASCWQMVLHNPWVGIGPGNGVFKQLYGLYMVPGFNALGTYSVPLAIAVEQGVMGMMALLGLLWLTLSNALSWLGDEQLAPHQRWWLLCVAVAVVGLGCQGMFDTVLYRPPVQVALWLWVAIGFSLLPPWATQQRPLSRS